MSPKDKSMSPTSCYHQNVITKIKILPPTLKMPVGMTPQGGTRLPLFEKRTAKFLPAVKSPPNFERRVQFNSKFLLKILNFD